MYYDVFDRESVQKLIKLQSFFRQNYVRNEIQKVRGDFEEIFDQIEGNDSDDAVIWPIEFSSSSSSICLPEFINKKQKKTQNNRDFLKKSLTINKTRNSVEKNTGQIVKFTPLDKVDSNKNNSVDTLFNVDLNLEQMNYLSIENLKKLKKSELLSVRENVSLEMLWIQQAIQSRLQV